MSTCRKWGPSPQVPPTVLSGPRSTEKSKTGRNSQSSCQTTWHGTRPTSLTCGCRTANLSRSTSTILVSNIPGKIPWNSYWQLWGKNVFYYGVGLLRWLSLGNDFELPHVWEIVLFGGLRDLDLAHWLPMGTEPHLPHCCWWVEYVIPVILEKIPQLLLQYSMMGKWPYIVSLRPRIT